MKLKIYNSKTNDSLYLNFYNSYVKEFDKFIKEVKTFSDVDLNAKASDKLN